MDSKLNIRRIGYKGSGFAFYFVQCQTRKAFIKYVTDTCPGVPEDIDLNTIEGLSWSYRESVFPGFLPDAVVYRPGDKAETLVSTYIVVPRAESFRIERKAWYHEIGHAADWCAKHLEVMRLCRGVASVGQCSDEETRALLTEFLMDAFDRFWEGNETDHGTSGLLDAMPWVERTKREGGAE